MLHLFHPNIQRANQSATTAKPIPLDIKAVFIALPLSFAALPTATNLEARPPVTSI